MSTPNRRFRSFSVVVAGFVIVAAQFTVSGCGLIEAAVDGSGEQVDIGSSDVPADFPDEVPLIEGEAVFGAATDDGDNRIWNVSIKVGEDALEVVSAPLEAAGFAATPIAETPDGPAITFTKHPFGVLVVLSSDDDGNPVAVYTVTRSSNG